MHGISTQNAESEYQEDYEEDIVEPITPLPAINLVDVKKQKKDAKSVDEPPLTDHDLKDCF